jgi:hypothetical protein
MKSILLTTLDFSAVIIQIIAAAIMFRYGAPNVPFGAFVGKNNPDYETPKKRQRWLKYGFGILLIGFVLQLTSLIIKII